MSAVTVDLGGCSDRVAEIRKEPPPRPAGAAEDSEDWRRATCWHRARQQTASCFTASRAASEERYVCSARKPIASSRLRELIRADAQAAARWNPDHSGSSAACARLRCDRRSLRTMTRPRNAIGARAGLPTLRSVETVAAPPVPAVLDMATAERWVPSFSTTPRASPTAVAICSLRSHRGRHPARVSRTDVLRRCWRRWRDHLEQRQNSQSAADEATWRFSRRSKESPKQSSAPSSLVHVGRLAADLPAVGEAGLATLRRLRGHDTVVLVDEAARAMPLDLFIPMARAKRIVLVGDHASSLIARPGAWARSSKEALVGRQ